MVFGTLNYIVLFTYLAGMLAVGVFLAGRQKTTEQYFLADRRMPWLVVGMSIFASLTSAVTYMGVPARAYEENIGILFGVLVSPLAAPVLILLFYPFSRRLNVTTSYEYVLHRYGRASRFTVSGLFVLARLGWLGAVIYAPALAISVATGLGFLATVAAFFASMVDPRVEVWGTVMGFFAGPILAVFLLGMLTKRANFTGWLIGTVVAISVVVWLRMKTQVHWVYYFPVTSATSFIMGYLLSLARPGLPVRKGLTVWDSRTDNDGDAQQLNSRANNPPD